MWLWAFQFENDLNNNDQSGFVRGTAKDGHTIHTHGEVVIQAAMSDNHNSILKVRVKQIGKSRVGELQKKECVHE